MTPAAPAECAFSILAVVQEKVCGGAHHGDLSKQLLLLPVQPFLKAVLKDG